MRYTNISSSRLTTGTWLISAFLTLALLVNHAQQTSAGTIRRIRRKRKKYSIVIPPPPSAISSTRSSRGVPLLLMKDTSAMDAHDLGRHLKKMGKGMKNNNNRRSRAGNQNNQEDEDIVSNANEVPTPNNNDNFLQTDFQTDNLDWDEMTNDELADYFFKLHNIQAAGSYPGGGGEDDDETGGGGGGNGEDDDETGGGGGNGEDDDETGGEGGNTPSQPTPRPTRRPAPSTPRPTVNSGTSPKPTAKTTARPTDKDGATTTPAPQPTPSTGGGGGDGGGSCDSMSRQGGLQMVLTTSSKDSESDPVIQDETVLMNPDTPQGLAFLWLVEIDSAQLDPCDASSRGRIEQRYTLATLYYATTVAGASWKDASGWLMDSDECAWFGVTCQTDGQVMGLQLRENDLDGALPAELISLSSLSVFDVPGNDIKGALVDMPLTLTFLDVEANRMTGDPFAALGGDRGDTLEQVHLSSNFFNGDIPTEIGEWTSLTELWMANNRFTGATIPTEIGNLENLETLFLYDARLGGTLPTELGTLDLTEFLANNNQFNGPIPEEFWDNSRLTLLRLDNNQLTGSISSRLGELEGLTDLFLSNNTFTSSLPVTMLRLTALVNLLLNDNKFSGTIRDGFDSFESLDFVDFSANEFTGTIPSTIFNALDLRFLYLSNNRLEGTLPDNWGSAPVLRDLFLDNNRLTGAVPEISQGDFSRLTELLLNNNGLTGRMPSSVCQLRTSAILEDLWADCAGSPPDIQCALPSCCTFCFE